MAETTSPETFDKPLAIAVWQAMKTLLAKETNEYLQTDRFVIHRDAFVRVSDDDIVEDVPFIAYEYNQITSDESLDFSFFFFKEYFHMTIGPTYFAIPYKVYSFGSSEVIQNEALDGYSVKTIAKNIVTTIKLLLNGQLAVGCHWNNGRLVASETFLLDFESRPLPIALTQNFSLTVRKALDYSVKQNHLLTGRIKINASFPLLPPVINGVMVRRGRDVETVHDLEPLTKKHVAELEDSFVLHEYAGTDASRSAVANLYASLYFWLITIVMVGLILFLRFSPLTPDFLHNIFALLVMALIARYIISFATGYLLALRQAKINRGERPLSFRIESFVGSHIFRRSKK